MAGRLETIDTFIERNLGEEHRHMIPSEARAFYGASVEGNIGSQRSLEGQKVILGCVVCSAVLAEVQPGVSPVGRNAVS
jgi:hypothetical protein